MDSPGRGRLQCLFGSPAAIQEIPMHPFPHRYTVAAVSEPTGDVRLSGDKLPDLVSAAPVEFDGPGDRWSPETLLCAAVADCFQLSFRAIARASRFDWRSLECTVEGTLDKVDNKSRFTELVVRATLHVPAGVDEARAVRLMEKAEQTCLITNSLLATRHLEPTVITD
jgi:organic hydroperoxide reductase OsmC/OhrA